MINFFELYFINFCGTRTTKRKIAFGSDFQQERKNIPVYQGEIKCSPKYSTLINICIWLTLQAYVLYDESSIIAQRSHTGTGIVSIVNTSLFVRILIEILYALYTRQ